MSTYHRPYSTRPSAATPTAALLPTGSDPEAFIARQEAMIQAGTHAMIAEKLALDAVRNQIERERRAAPGSTAPVITTGNADGEPAANPAAAPTELH